MRAGLPRTAVVPTMDGAVSTPVWPQVDAGVALVLGVIVETAAIRKLQRPRVFGLTLQRLDPALTGRRVLATRLAIVVAGYEAAVGAGVVVVRGPWGFAFACGMLVACAGFLVALARAVQQSVPCGCFGRLGRTAAGGREIGRATALLAGAAFLVVHRALDAGTGYGVGPIAFASALATVAVILMGQRCGAALRPRRGGLRRRRRRGRACSAFARRDVPPRGRVRQRPLHVRLLSDRVGANTIRRATRGGTPRLHRRRRRAYAR